ncbi:hypothetical protein [Streptomyces sp. NBC_00059]|uniref:hypothetical protein n=1 Tax=Streptomyces sp. NBC_00059 TaxID=2975635 RepID=UPI0022523CAD|nr:hypothetical protein [Streptomyces sp. NBC_00059]MCX5417607.1 hypothetical protein [Streptomyces sp. NBC_00059]
MRSTLPVELIVLASGSLVAAANFVLGTTPPFSTLGPLFRRTGRALPGQLATLSGRGRPGRGGLDRDG